MQQEIAKQLALEEQENIEREKLERMENSKQKLQEEEDFERIKFLKNNPMYPKLDKFKVISEEEYKKFIY